jgi:hypothetical protein
MNNITFTYLKQPLHRYTFEAPKIKQWVENNCEGLTLNLFAGETKLNINEIRNDLNLDTNPNLNMDALECCKYLVEKKYKFDTILLDPPYSYRKSMEKYNGRISSPFNQIKDQLSYLTHKHSRIITFGYHSTCMGKKRGFNLIQILLICHGGAQHDTIAIVEEKVKEGFLY